MAFSAAGVAEAGQGEAAGGQGQGPGVRGQGEEPGFGPGGTAKLGGTF